MDELNSRGSKQHVLEELRERLSRAEPSQEHVLAAWPQLDDTQRESLARQIRSIDLARVSTLFAARHSSAATSWRELAERAEPPRAVRLVDQQDPRRRQLARQAGIATLRAGEVAVLIVAGGQGSRLRFEHPKGMYPLGPVSNRTLFQILFDKVLAIGQRYGARPPVYLMTSAATHDETLAYMDEHARCGLAADQLHVFRQGDMPALDASTGQLLLEAPGRLALSPDGHGGMLAAFRDAGWMAAARERGIRRIFYCQVDNPLVQLADPELLGWHLVEQSEATTQVVAKRFALERVGNVVSLDGQTQVIEYSDLPSDIAERTNADGSLRLWAGNLAVHIFELEFLERMASGAGRLPFHLAHKVVPFADAAGNLVTPSSPNAIKLERFIFDLLPAARRALVVEGRADEAFAPVKNHDSEGLDSPATARQAMIAQATRWLRAAGIEVVDGVPVELHPRFALEAGDLVERLPVGTRLDRPTYLA